VGSLRRIASSSLTRLVVSSEIGIFLGFDSGSSCAGCDGNLVNRRMCGHYCSGGMVNSAIERCLFANQIVIRGTRRIELARRMDCVQSLGVHTGVKTLTIHRLVHTSHSTADIFGQHPHYLPCILALLKLAGLAQPQRSRTLAHRQAAQRVRLPV
jgi:hypothetical protein